jgi:long-subunit fatty acid transport protein
MDVDIKSLVYPSAGIAYQLRPWLLVAASFRGGRQPTTDLTVRIEGDIGSATRDPIVSDAFVNIRSLSLSHFQPDEFTLGFDAQLTRRLAIAADLSLFRWSQYTNPASRVETMLSLGQFDEFVDAPSARPLDPANFHDIIIPRVGLEYLAAEGSDSKLHARAGYHFEPSPAPEQIGVTNFVDNDKHTASLGLGLSYRPWARIFLRPLSLDASVSATMLSERKHRKVSPVDPVGDYLSDGIIWQFITTTRFRFE